MEITYRISTKEDIDALVKFWGDNSGWDIIDRATWEHRFTKTPLGDSSIALAVDEHTDEILGQFVFIPSLVSVNGSDVMAYRPFAPIVKESLQQDDAVDSLQQLIFQMYLIGTQELIAKGGTLIHMLPDPRWARLFKMVPFFQTATFPLYSHPLLLDAPFQLAEGHEVEKLDFSDPRIDGLWQKARKFYGCMFVRNQSMLSWKNSHREYQIHGLVQGSELKGVFVSLPKEQDKQWLICDLLAANEAAIATTLMAACNTAHQYQLAIPEREQQLEKIAILATPLMEPAIKKMGFGKEKYRFTLVVHILDESLPKEQVAPENWYISAND